MLLLCLAAATATDFLISIEILGNTPCPAGTFCVNGQCIPNTCPDGAVFRNGQCVATSSSAGNCGQYGVLCPTYCLQGLCQCVTSINCPPGYVCNGGRCLPSSCPSGLTFCGATASCVDLTTGDNQGRNCGGCGINCLSGQCTGGACVCSSSAECPAGYDCLGNLCILH